MFALIGVAVASGARSPSDRYRTLKDLMAADDEPPESGTETTVRGPVDVIEPATPSRDPSSFPEADAPESATAELAALGDGDPPALWAWRVREQVDTGGQGADNRWRTVESGLAVGEFAVRESWERVGVDADAVAAGPDGDGVEDPLDAGHLFLGDPDVDVPLSEQGPLTRFLERVGIAGEGGRLSDWEFSVSLGRTTLTPDHYQAVVVREGEDLVAHGELVETAGGQELRGTDDSPPVLARGDLDEKLDRMRSRARVQVGAGGFLVLVGVGVAALGVAGTL